MKNKKGITLIALVITIVILIILAGVAINLSLGNNGIFNKSKQAKEEYINSAVSEERELNELYAQMYEESNNSNSNNEIEKLIEFKKALAEYIESKNVNKPEISGDANVYINSFEKVLELSSNVAETEAATSEDIAEGKKAWVNGVLITGIANNYENLINNAVSVSKTKNINISTTYTYTFSPEDFGFEKIYGIQNVTIDEQYILDIKLVEGNIEVKMRNLTSNYALNITVTVTAIGQ